MTSQRVYEEAVTMVSNGVDHKASHTAVAIDGDERPIARLCVTADRRQVERLLAGAEPLDDQRTWAVESAGGLGRLLAQQLVGAGEYVVDVPATLAARVRLLGSSKASKNDPNDALSTAIAGLRHDGLRPVVADDHTAVLRLLADRHRDRVALRTQVACRLHVVLRELVAGGAPLRLRADRAASLLRRIHPATAVDVERKRLANDLLADMRRLDRDIVALKARIGEAVAASGTTLVELHGVGPIVAAIILGQIGDQRRFPTRDRFAAYNGTAPIEASSGPRVRHRLNPRGNRQLNHALQLIAVTQIAHDWASPLIVEGPVVQLGRSRRPASCRWRSWCRWAGRCPRRRRCPQRHDRVRAVARDHDVRPRERRRRHGLGVVSAAMEYRTLGSTGTIVSAQCLGTMTFGDESDEETAQAQLDLFVERGGNFVDTADVYSRGRSEEIIGRWLAARAGMQDRVVIATKGRFPMGDGPNDAGLSRPHLGRALEASLRRLGVDTVDLYQAHAWDPLTPLEETLGFFDDAVRTGKVRYVGVSNFVGWQLQKAAFLAGDAAPIVTLQPQYNLLVRDIELEIVDVCRNEGIGILPWSPLAGGWLTGKYTRDEPPTGATRLGEDPGRGMEAYGPRNAQERTWRIIDVVREVAEGRGVPMSRVALAWVADRPAVTSVILGARTLAQLDDNLGAAGLHLSDKETELLNDASAPLVADYPYGGPSVDQRSRDLG